MRRETALKLMLKSFKIQASADPWDYHEFAFNNKQIALRKIVTTVFIMALTIAFMMRKHCYNYITRLQDHKIRRDCI